MEEKLIAKITNSKYNNIKEINYRSLVENRIEYFKGIEPNVTKTLDIIAKNTGGELAGLDFKLKNSESLYRKVKDDVKEKNITFSNALYEVNDILRYTLVQNENNFTDTYFLVKKFLEKQGYSIMRVKNTFKNNVTYKGINTLVKDDKGNIFELQFHTHKSLHIKENELHELYEKQRVLDFSIDDVLYKKLIQKMINLSNTINIPKGVERIR
ncbi:hypothetical protein [Gemella sp. zg-1178]|uniref:hypothetical protein n=1 Tax=Gemella sp. zg-1178 TaxID=2840372 RepID=UPI001C05551D|nr:hypothetical protein [Gemella sp. zg-1178]MBU0279348.1 hypothetical protein [Gemella sp. zg-1178]